MSESESSVHIKAPAKGCLRCCVLKFAEKLKNCAECNIEDFKDLNFDDWEEEDECPFMEQSEKGKEKIPPTAKLEPLNEEELLELSEDVDV